MQDTKERILRQALALFASGGYEGVSVRDIAGRLGMAQSALYKHFGSKRDILESILLRMQAADAARAKDFAMPETRYAEGADAYRHTTAEALRAYTLAQFRYWTEDPFASAFRRLLTIEQYRTPEMAALYQQYLSGGVIDYLADLFRETPELFAARQGSPRQIALSFYAPVYMLQNLYDGAADPAAVTALAAAHIDRFFMESPTLGGNAHA